MKTPNHGRGTRSGFTLIELLICVGIIAVLSGLLLLALGQVRTVAQGAHCANSLRQLGVVTRLYLNEHDNKFFAYSTAASGGRLWYFGYETSSSLGAAEGQRTIDVTQSPLYPYIQQVGGIEVCPSFPYNSLSSWKPKYKGASWGYGFNTFLSNVNIMTLGQQSQTIVFGDCAQVNTFQSPASPSNPMVEEFYMIQNTYKTIHFRHGASANLLFLDGHVEKFKMYPGTADTTLKNAKIGRITPVGSMDYLQYLQ